MTDPSTLTSLPLLDLVQVGDPVEHRGVVVWPLFPRRQPVCAYVTLEDALPRGLAIREVSETGAVPELAVSNPLDERVLLYDGEELVGAKQNRILNVSVLVPERTTLPIPVSCVEQGRWSRVSEEFAPAAHAAGPELRRRKHDLLAAAPLARGVAQGEVWAAVADTHRRLGIDSQTGAQADAFRAREADLGSLRAAFPLSPGQSGCATVIAGQACVDVVSRPDAFARLYPKVLDGYLLDSLATDVRPVASAGQVGALLERASQATVRRTASAGLGTDLRLTGDRVVGSGLALDGELLQLTLFSGEDGRTVGRPIASPRRRLR